MPWGLAEEAGRAVRWLEARGLAGADALVDVLGRPRPRPPQQQGIAWTGDCPIYVGAALTDRASEIAPKGVNVRVLVGALLLLPALALIARQRPLMLAWAGGRGFLGPSEVWLDGEVPEGLIRARPGNLRSGVKLLRVPPRALPDGALKALTALARKTYAPAHLGREGGAGAGPTDND